MEVISRCDFGAVCQQSVPVCQGHGFLRGAGGPLQAGYAVQVLHGVWEEGVHVDQAHGTLHAGENLQHVCSSNPAA